ncbi:MAG: hypothetical protein K0R49_925 [Burkholderiales bacterium]|jgi:hypothetical protein|nr:hypothetical protein [Burkholderiales bacterium]
MNQINFIKRAFRLLRKINISEAYRPRYRLLEIFKEEDDKFTALIQLINKNVTFYAKPEDILADDKFVDSLSPRDVRTLTYLGYLEINQPTYKLLAQRFTENNSNIFVVKKRGDNKPLIKTAAEINQEAEILLNMSAHDARAIGYALATSEINQEKEEKNIIKRELESK